MSITSAVSSAISVPWPIATPHRSFCQRRCVVNAVADHLRLCGRAEAGHELVREQPQANGTQSPSDSPDNLRVEMRGNGMFRQRIFSKSLRYRGSGLDFGFSGGFEQADEMDLLANEPVSLDADNMEFARSVEAECAFEESRRPCHFHTVHDNRHGLPGYRDVGEVSALRAKGESRDVAMPRAGFPIDHDATVPSVFRNERKSGTVRGEDKALLYHGIPCLAGFAINTAAIRPPMLVRKANRLLSELQTGMPSALPS